MRAPKTIGAFFGWLVAGLLCVSLADIYALGRFEAAIGTRLDNFLISAFFDALIALVVTAGFAVAVLRQRGSQVTFPARHLFTAGVVATGLVYVFTFTGLWLSARFESWQLNVTAFVLYGVIVGVAIATVLVRLSSARHHAA
jgi:hypothetical protein